MRKTTSPEVTAHVQQLIHKVGGIKSLPSCRSLRQFCKTIPASACFLGLAELFIAKAVFKAHRLPLPTPHCPASYRGYPSSPQEHFNPFSACKPPLRARFPWNSTWNNLPCPKPGDSSDILLSSNCMEYFVAIENVIYGDGEENQNGI